MCSAKDGEKGLEMIRSENLDLITLNLVMPNKTGVKGLRTIKNDNALQHIPLIIISGLADFIIFLKKNAALFLNRMLSLTNRSMMRCY